jgi:hypothetical protein
MDIREKLRDYWNSMNVGDVVWAKYSDGWFHRGRIVRTVGGTMLKIKDDYELWDAKTGDTASIGLVISRYFERDTPYVFP